MAANRIRLRTIDPVVYTFVFEQDTGPKLNLRRMKFGREGCLGLQKPWIVEDEWILFRG